MSSFGNYPDKYLLFNKQISKNLAVVLKIEDVPDVFGVADTYTQIRYGDSGIVYGLPGVVYGGLRRLNQVKPFMQLDSGLTIQQRIEPEQGRGNIGTINVSFIDYNGQLSKIVSPGFVVDEILSGKQCRLYIGYTQTSFPEDYVLLYQGYITQVVCPPGLVKLQISDTTLKKRQPIFDVPNTKLIAPMDAVTTTCFLESTSALYQQILGPDGTYDRNVTTYIKVDDEVMEYAATGIISDHEVLVTRPVLGTVAAEHEAGAEAMGAVGFGQEVNDSNVIDLALKILLSGWNGPSETDVSVLSFVYDYQGNFVPNEFVLKTDDAVLDLGLSVGDAFYVTGSASGNNISGFITGITTGANGKKSIIETDQTFTLENPTDALVAFRSQFDTLPIKCGSKCRMSDVDVSTFLAIKHSYFAAGATSAIRGYFDQVVLAKDFIDSEIMLPFGCYSVSRYGRISMAITKPPLPGVGAKLLELNYTNVLDPDKIVITRSVNSRSFYNVVSYEYNYDVAIQAFTRIQYFVDTASINSFGQNSTLPIQARLLDVALGGSEVAQERGTALLNRFKNCLITIELTVNWSIGSLIEVSDIVVLRDEGNLKIMNFETGERNLGVQLFEVIDRNYQIISGNVKLKLLGGLGFSVDSRFGLYSPSTILDTGCTTTKLRLTPSYGQTLISNEVMKWIPLVGNHIQVHSPDWSVTGAGSVVLGASPTDPAGLDISPPLPFAPTAGFILDIAPYPTDTDPSIDPYAKLLYAHLTPTLPVLSGTGDSQFTVSATGAALIKDGDIVMMRKTDYSATFPQRVVQSVIGDVVTLETGIGVPIDSTFSVDGIGFNDGTSFYRYS